MGNEFEINIDFLHSYSGKKELSSTDFNNAKNLFSIFDKDKDGKLSKTEIEQIFNHFKDIASSNKDDKRNIGHKIIDEKEAETAIEQTQNNEGKTFKELGITIKEIMSFFKTLQNNAEEPEDFSEDSMFSSKISEELPPDSQETEALSAEQSDIIESFKNIPQRGEQQFSKAECEKLAHLTDEELEKAQKLFYVEARQTQFSAEDIIYMVRDYKEKFSIPEENFERMNELFNLNNREGAQLSGDDIMQILSLPPDKIDKAKELLTSPARASNPIDARTALYIINSGSQTLYDLAYNNPETELEIPDSGNRDIRQVTIDGKNYRFITGMELPEEITEKQENGAKIVQIYNPNIGKRQTITYQYIDGYDQEIPSKIETQYLDSNGNTTKTEIIENSNISGVPSIYSVDSNGNRTTIQSAEIDSKTGEKKITKHLTDDSGNFTDYTLRENSDNEYELSYTIKNNNGQTLYQKEQSLKKTGENTYEYNMNGNKYSLKIDSDKLQITNSSGDIHEINLKDLIKDEEDKVFLAQIVKMPADLLIFLAKHPLDGLDFGNFNNNNGHYNNDNNTVEIGTQDYVKSESELNDTVFSILMHEIGHYVDNSTEDDGGIISENNDIAQVYKEELENFKKNHTSAEQEILTYFSGASKTERRGRSETFAEFSMLLNTNPKKVTETRSYYLQRYFPKTAALVAQMTSSRLKN